jgi:hypothetical protein
MRPVTAIFLALFVSLIGPVLADKSGPPEKPWQYDPALPNLFSLISGYRIPHDRTYYVILDYYCLDTGAGLELGKDQDEVSVGWRIRRAEPPPASTLKRNGPRPGVQEERCRSADLETATWKSRPWGSAAWE